MARGHREQELTIVFQGRTTAFPPSPFFIFPFSTFNPPIDIFLLNSAPFSKRSSFASKEMEMGTGMERSREETRYLLERRNFSKLFNFVRENYENSVS